MAKILIVDDAQDFREMVEDILVDEGHDVAMAENAELALKRCADERFDLILCDLVLPVGDSEDMEDENDSAMVGVSAVRTLSSKYPDVPIIAVSGQMTGAPLRMMTKFGAINCLSKPFGREELLAAVNGALK